jgi:hypothetical protein
MRRLVVSAAVIAITAYVANAQTFLGFRLLDFDGRNIAWSAASTDQPPTVTYAFVTSDMDFPDARNCSTIGPVGGLLKKSNLDAAEFRQEVRAAFDMWEAAANITFQESTDQATAKILIGAQREPYGRAFTNVSYKGDAGGRHTLDRSLICLNPEQGWKFGFDGNLNVYDVRYSMAHEIGHAIGLDHPAPTGQLMGYRYEEKFRTLQQGDIGGAVALYGAPPGAGQTKVTKAAATIAVTTP